MKHDVSKNAAENRNKTKRSFSHTVPNIVFFQLQSSEIWLCEDCMSFSSWILADCSVSSRCLPKDFIVTFGTMNNGWQIHDGYLPTLWSQPDDFLITPGRLLVRLQAATRSLKIKKLHICEKNNCIPEAQEIGKKSFVRKTMVHCVLDCMHGLFHETKLRKMLGVLSWYFFVI